MITAHMATFPPRAPIVRKAVNSLINQVDKVFIYFNEYDEDSVPSWAKDDDRIVWECSESSGYGDLGDVGKFYFCSEEMREKYGVTGTVLTCDDDIFFPAWHSDRALRYLNSEAKGAIASHHGAIIDPNCSDYYARRKKTFQVLFNVVGIHRVNVPGTGCMFFNLEVFKPSLSMFKHINMTDIFVGKWATENNVTVLAVPHKKGDFKYLNPKSTIYDATKSMDGSSRDTRSNVISVVEDTDWEIL